MIELKDTKRVRYRTKRKIVTQLKAVNGEIAMIRPKRVATPFPPLNSAQIGKIWPNTAARPSPI
jgi:hypothetical protein